MKAEEEMQMTNDQAPMTNLESRLAGTLASILAVRVRTLFFHAHASVEHGTHNETIHNQNKEHANDTSAIFFKKSKQIPNEVEKHRVFGFPFSS